MFSVIMTNTAITVLRFCGQYVQMADALRPVAAEVIQGLTSLYDLYLYSVYQFYSEKDKCGADKLEVTISRIHDSTQHLPILEPMSGFVDFSCDNFYGLGNRIVAIESVLNLARQMNGLRPYLQSCLPDSRKVLFNKFYTTAVLGAPNELRNTILIPFCRVIVDWKGTLNLIMQVKWDIKIISGEHSPYVDTLVNHMIQVKKILQRIARNIKLSTELEEIIWVCNTD